MLKNKNKGITLVALVITIIILLILAGISISALTNTGIFQKAKDAKQKSEDAALDQNTKLDEYENELDKYLPKQNENSLAKAVKVGDYVAYTPDELDNNALTTLKTNLKNYSGASDNTTNSAIDIEKDLKWRVLDVDETTGQVRLISATPTKKSIELNGYNGYNNAVKLLDDACSTLYNSKLATKVQNLKIEDITKYMKTQPTEDTTPYSPTSKYYPEIILKEKGQTVNETPGRELDLSEQKEFINQTTKPQVSSWTLKKTYWSQIMNNTDSFTDSKYYELFINNGSNYPTYWMSSRCVDAYSYYASSVNADFDVCLVDSDRVVACSLYYSAGREGSNVFAFRPVITLNSNVQVTSGNGSPESSFNIQ